MSTFTPNLNLEEPALGADVNSWNVPLNSNFTIIDQAIAGSTSVALTSSNVSLTNVQSAFRIITFTGTLTASVTVTLAGITGEWVFDNQTSGAFTVTVKAVSGDAGIVVPQGQRAELMSNGAVMKYCDVTSVAGRQGAVTLAVADVSGAAPLASPALTGTPTAPTQTPGDNTTAVATDAFVTAAIAAQVVRTPQVSVLTSGTAATYSTPAGAAYLDITDLLGGGSGGGGSGSGSPGIGTAGGATSFGSLTANGGPATPVNTSATYPTPATATGGDTNVPGGVGGTVNIVGSVPSVASSGASSPLGYGGSGGGVNTGGNVAAGNATGYGAGGGGGGFSASASYNSGWGGNAGAYLKAIITSPAATYTYTIGAAGTGGAAGTSGSAGGNGSGGFIRVVAHFQ